MTACNQGISIAFFECLCEQIINLSEDIEQFRLRADDGGIACGHGIDKSRHVHAAHLNHQLPASAVHGDDLVRFSVGRKGQVGFAQMDALFLAVEGNSAEASPITDLHASRCVIDFPVGDPYGEGRHKIEQNRAVNSREIVVARYGHTVGIAAPRRKIVFVNAVRGFFGR